MYEHFKSILKDTPIETLPHQEFKQKTGMTKAIIRTAEFTPYSNIILVAGAWGFNL